MQLARTDVGHIRIADADIVELSNINRQVIAEQRANINDSENSVESLLVRLLFRNAPASRKELR